MPAQQFSVRWTRTDTYAAATYRFSVTVDDGIRVFLDNTLILNAWTDQPPTSYYVDRQVVAGSHTVKVEYYNNPNGGQATYSAQDVTTLPPTTGAWIGSYYGNASLSGVPAINRDDGPTFNFFFDGVAPPVPGVPAQQFSVRWNYTGTYAAGTYTFTITTDDGMRVFVDGTNIIDAWIPQPPTTYTANYNLSNGTHSITVEYYNGVNGGTAALSIQNASGFTTTAITGGLTLPTAFAFAPDGRIFIAQKNGAVLIVKNGALLPTPFYTVQSLNNFHDRGLIGLTLDPNFGSNGYVYLAFTYDPNPADLSGPKNGRVLRVTAGGDTASPGSELVLLGTAVGTPSQPSCESLPLTDDCIPSDGESHSIGNVKFGADGMLYVTTGDAASFSTVDPLALRAQSIDRLAGKILRVNPANGQGLSDNPFYDGNPSDTRSKVWAYGERNAFRFNFRPGAGTIYSGDVGWDTWEEINVVTRGVNLGWPCYEGNPQQGGYAAFSQCQSLYASGGVTFGLYTYQHAAVSAAVVGGSFAASSTYPAPYRNAYWFGDYVRGEISMLQIDSSNNMVPGSLQTIIEGPADGPVAIETGPDGDIYYLSINDGMLMHLRYLNGARPPVAVAAATPNAGQLPLAVNFSSAGSNDPNPNPALTYDWSFGDGSPHSSAVSPTYQYAVNGQYVATLTVSDTYGLRAQATVTINAGNSPPVPTITSPAWSLTTNEPAPPVVLKYGWVWQLVNVASVQCQSTMFQRRPEAGMTPSCTSVAPPPKAIASPML